jgi:hypothetical protein
MSGHGWNLTRHCRIPISHSAVTFSYNSGLNQVLCFVLCRTSRDSTTPLQFYLYSRFLPSESSDINRYTADNLIFCHNTDKLFTKIAGNCTEIRRSSSPTFCYIGGKGGGIEGIVQPIYVFIFIYRGSGAYPLSFYLRWFSTSIKLRGIYFQYTI